MVNIHSICLNLFFLDSKLSTDNREYHSQHHVHLVDHTPLKRTFITSKGKALKIVNSDLDSSSDDDVIDIVRHQTPNNNQICIPKDNKSSQEEQVFSAKIVLEENSSVEIDHKITEYENSVPDQQLALNQEEGENSSRNGKIFIKNYFQLDKYIF